MGRVLVNAKWDGVPRQGEGDSEGVCATVSWYNVSFRCMACHNLKCADGTVFRVNALNKAIWCSTCRKSKPTRKWACLSGIPWFACVTHHQVKAKLWRPRATKVREPMSLTQELQGIRKLYRPVPTTFGVTKKIKVNNELQARPHAGAMENARCLVQVDGGITCEEVLLSPRSRRIGNTVPGVDGMPKEGGCCVLSGIPPRIEWGSDSAEGPSYFDMSADDHGDGYLDLGKHTQQECGVITPSGGHVAVPFPLDHAAFDQCKHIEVPVPQGDGDLDPRGNEQCDVDPDISSCNVETGGHVSHVTDHGKQDCCDEGVLINASGVLCNSLVGAVRCNVDDVSSNVVQSGSSDNAATSRTAQRKGMLSDVVIRKIDANRLQALERKRRNHAAEVESERKKMRNTDVPGVVPARDDSECKAERRPKRKNLEACANSQPTTIQTLPRGVIFVESEVFEVEHINPICTNSAGHIWRPNCAPAGVDSGVSCQPFLHVNFERADEKSQPMLQCASNGDAPVRDPFVDNVLSQKIYSIDCSPAVKRPCTSSDNPQCIQLARVEVAPSEPVEPPMRRIVANGRKRGNLCHDDTNIENGASGKRSSSPPLNTAAENALKPSPAFRVPQCKLVFVGAPRSKRRLGQPTGSSKLVRLGFLRPDSKLAIQFHHLVGKPPHEMCEELV